MFKFLRMSKMALLQAYTMNATLFPLRFDVYFRYVKAACTITLVLLMLVRYPKTVDYSNVTI